MKKRILRSVVIVFCTLLFIFSVVLYFRFEKKYVKYDYICMYKRGGVMGYNRCYEFFDCGLFCLYKESGGLGDKVKIRILNRFIYDYLAYETAGYKLEDINGYDYYSTGLWDGFTYGMVLKTKEGEEISVNSYGNVFPPGKRISPLVDKVDIVAKGEVIKHTYREVRYNITQTEYYDHYVRVRSAVRRNIIRIKERFECSETIGTD